MTNSDKVTSSQHLGRDTADIRIRINPEIYIRIPDHFSLKLQQ